MMSTKRELNQDDLDWLHRGGDPFPKTRLAEPEPRTSGLGLILALAAAGILVGSALGVLIMGRDFFVAFGFLS